MTTIAVNPILNLILHPADILQAIIIENGMETRKDWLAVNDYDPHLAALEALHYWTENHPLDPKQSGELYKLFVHYFRTQILSSSRNVHGEELVFKAVQNHIPLKLIYTLSTASLQEMVEWTD